MVLQLVTEYVIVAVPALTPLTKPLPLTVATDGVLLLQVPPGTLFDSVVVDPIATLVLPVMAPGVSPVVTTMLFTAYDGHGPDIQ